MTLQKLLLPLCLLAQVTVHAQSISVNNDGSLPDNSAMLDISSTTKGLLIPRMTQAQRNVITSPATGLLIFQMDAAPGYYYNAGTPASPNWTALGGPAQWLNNGSKIYYNADFVGIGTNNPSSRLHIRQDANTNTSLIIENPNVGASSGESLVFANEEGNVAGITMFDVSSTFGSAMSIMNNRSGGYIRLGTAGNSRLSVGNNGRIAIGSNFTNPDGLLHVRGVDWTTAPVILEGINTGVVGPSLRFTSPTRSYDIIGATGSGAGLGADYFSIFDNTASAYRFAIAPGGQVGIGAAPFNTTKLYVESTTETYGGYFTNNTSGVGRYGLYAESNNGGGLGYGIRTEGGYMGAYLEGNAPGFNGNIYGVYGYASGSGNVGTHHGIYGFASGGAINWAGYFNGNVHVAGTISKSAGTFKIDHPLDPANKTLSHSFVESPDMLNVYTGNVMTDGEGTGIAELPAYFQALNITYTYQLTVIGQFAQAIVLKEISGNRFTIKTDKPNVKVSWMVTGIRNDPYAQKNRVVPEQNKSTGDRGLYLNPEAYDQPASKSIGKVPEKARL